jgi:TMEM175 potassium channel family protein
MSGIAYYILVHALLAVNGQDSALAHAIGRDFKGRISVVVYVVAIAVSFIYAPVSMALYVAVAIMWFVPDRRIERTIKE